MGQTLTADDIADLHRWQTVISADLYYVRTSEGEGTIMVPNHQALETSPVLRRHMRYHARLESSL